jgi:hypothetical protein
MKHKLQWFSFLTLQGLSSNLTAVLPPVTTKQSQASTVIVDQSIPQSVDCTSSRGSTPTTPRRSPSRDRHSDHSQTPEPRIPVQTPAEQ